MADGMLEQIIEKTRSELELRKCKIPADMFDLEGSTKSLKKAIRSAKGNAVITEIKPASPSEGMLRKPDVENLARQMENGGAVAISVLTEPFYFHGSLNNLKRAKSATNLPIIRKDFIIDRYQLLEAKHYGADAVLLMVAVLGRQTKVFYEMARNLGMEAIVEIHDPDEADIALSSGSEIIGINNRNLENLIVDLNTTKELASRIPKNRVTISESGIRTREDLDFVLGYVDAALIGTSLMLADDVQEAVRRLVK